MGYDFKKVDVTDVEVSQKVSKETFYAAYRQEGEQALLDSYFAEEMSLAKLTAELKDLHMHFFCLCHEVKVLGYVKVNVEAAQTVDKGA